MKRIASLGCLALISCVPKKVDSGFRAFEAAYFKALFEASPAYGTASGLHEYDARLDDLSRPAIGRRIAALKQQAGALQAIRAKGGLTKAETIDADFLANRIQSELLDLETLEIWRRNPMAYVSVAGGAIDGLMKRNFAPPLDRLRSVTSRVRGVPALMAAMRANVENPPKEFTDLAIRMAGGSVGFFKATVAGWAKGAAGGDAAALAEFEQANKAAIEAVETATAWLKTDLLPRSKGAYAIGEANFRRKLLLDEMVDAPLAEVLATGEANLERDRQAFIETARKINPRATPLEVMRSLSAEHPGEKELLDSMRATLDGARRFLIEKNIIPIPSEVRPTVAETPPYARSGSFASMDNPGPYETKATEAFYYVTPVEAEWDARHKEEHLRAYNRPAMEVITVHEAYPGHYVQFLYSPKFPSMTRKVLYAASNAEGWAHYAEQMMLDEGFGGGDPKLGLAQLHEALLRDCRYIAGIKLHTAGMTVAEAAKIFVERGFQEPANGFEEARRGAYDPTYLYYTLGKLMIYKLRADYAKQQGTSYSLRGFHDAFIREGSIPIPLIRRILLREDRGPLF